MLGWEILDDAEYNVDFRKLSEEEQELIGEVQERFKERARLKNIETEDEASELIEKLLDAHCESEGICLGSSQRSYLSEFALYHMYKAAFLSRLMEDPEIEEISVVGVGKPAYVFLKKKGWLRTNACFTDSAFLSETVNKMAAKTGRRVVLQNPRLNAVLMDGSRLHASLPPVSPGEVTIRKFNPMPFTPAQLCQETVARDAMALLSLIIQGDFSVIIAGNTASGKTSTLNSLFSFIPLNERIVLVEDTPEINIPHPHQVRMVPQDEMGINVKELIRDTLRMRPDRMVVGEARGKADVEALFDVLLGGQARGSYATFHAQSAAEAVQRMKGFGISDSDMLGIDALVVQRRMLVYDRKKRRTREDRRITEIAGFNGGKAMTLLKNGKANAAPFMPRLCEALELSEKEVKGELKEREAMLGNAKLDFHSFLKKAQKSLYGIDYEAD